MTTLGAPIVLEVSLGDEHLTATLCRREAPRSCALLLSLLPYRGCLLHARWSGEACWSPLSSVWPSGETLQAEDPSQEPHSGEILLYGGCDSEPELYIPYGINRFACSAGRLTGNRVLRIQGGCAPLAAIGARVWRQGALSLELRRPHSSQ